MTWRNLLRLVRLPNLLLLSTLLPVVFMLMFTYVFGGAIERTMPPAAGGRYVNWLLPGLLAQFAVFGAGQTAVGLAEDLATGVLERFRSLPMARSAVLAGRIFSDVMRSALMLALMTAVGIAIGFRWRTGLLSVLGGFAVALVFGYAWSWVMAFVGLLARTQESVQSAVFIGVFPLAFTSSVFVPTQTMPSWLRPFAEHQPVTVLTDAMRGLMLGPGALPPGHSVTGEVVSSLIWAAAITAVFAPLAVQVYRRTLG
jgi:ABC transporter DrrB family efflux protein